MKILKIIVVLFAAAFLVGCSLLKVAVSTGDPISKADMNLRTMSRGFYYDMASEVAQTADSIASATPDPQVTLAAIRWKIRATRAGVEAAMQAMPEVAMADLWILCRRQHKAFASTPDSLLFGAQSPLARDVAARLERRAAEVAREALPAARYDLLSRFVEAYMQKNPAVKADAASNTTLAWLEFLRQSGAHNTYATGTIAEVLADVNDRLSGQTQQLSNSVGWSKDMLEVRFAQDSLRTQLVAQLDSLERNFSRLTLVAENLPAISEKMLGELSRQATQLIWTMNAAVDNAFGQLGGQREALQSYISQEREMLTTELRSSSNELLQKLLDAAPGVIGKALFYIVLCLLLLLGVPFALGFWLGGVRERVRERRKQTEK